MDKTFPENIFENVLFRHCSKLEVFVELFSKTDPPEVLSL